MVTAGLESLVQRAARGLEAFPKELDSVDPQIFQETLSEFATLRERMARGNLRLDIDGESHTLAAVLNRSLMALTGAITKIDANKKLSPKLKAHIVKARQDFQRVHERLETAAKSKAQAQQSALSSPLRSFEDLEKSSPHFAPWREQREKQLIERGLERIAAMIEQYAKLKKPLPRKLAKGSSFEVFRAPLYATFEFPLDLTKWRNVGIPVEAIWPGYLLSDQLLLAIPSNLSRLRYKKLVNSAISQLKKQNKVAYTNMLSETLAGIIKFPGNKLGFVWLLPIRALASLGRVIVKELTFPYPVEPSEHQLAKQNLQTLTRVLSPESVTLHLVDQQVNPDLKSLRQQMEEEIANRGQGLVDKIKRLEGRIAANYERLLELDSYYEQRKEIERALKKAGRNPARIEVHWLHDHPVKPRILTRIERLEEKIRTRRSTIRRLKKRLEELRAEIAAEFRQKKLGHR